MTDHAVHLVQLSPLGTREYHPLDIAMAKDVFSVSPPSPLELGLLISSTSSGAHLLYRECSYCGIFCFINEPTVKVFREVLEAAIVIAVLLSLVEQIILKSGASHPSLSSQTHQGESGSSLGRPRTHESKKDSQEGPNAPQVHTSEPEDAQLMSENKRRLIHKMRIQVFAGAAAGFFIAVVMYE